MKLKGVDYIYVIVNEYSAGDEFDNFILDTLGSDYSNYISRLQPVSSQLDLSKIISLD